MRLTGNVQLIPGEECTQLGLRDDNMATVNCRVGSC